MSNNDVIAHNAAAAADYRDDPRHSAARLQLSNAVYANGEFNGAIPEAATSWARPGEDLGHVCACSYTNAEAEDHYLTCPAAAAAPIGERAAALARVALSTASQAAQSGPSAFATGSPAVDDPVSYYANLMTSMGLSIHDTGARDDGDPTDHDQPSKGGAHRVTGGIYDTDIGSPEDITARHPEMFTHPPADPPTFGQRARGPWSSNPVR